MENLLGWFGELDAGRPGNGAGPNPLAWSEIEAWSRLTGIVLDPWEIGVIRALDLLRLTWKPSEPVITPDMFDRHAMRRGMRLQ